MNWYTNYNVMGLLTTPVGSKIYSSNGRGVLSPRGTVLSGVDACASFDPSWARPKLLSLNARGIPIAWPADKRNDRRIKKSIVEVW